MHLFSYFNAQHVRFFHADTGVLSFIHFTIRCCGMGKIFFLCGVVFFSVLAATSYGAEMSVFGATQYMRTTGARMSIRIPLPRLKGTQFSGSVMARKSRPASAASPSRPGICWNTRIWLCRRFWVRVKYISDKFVNGFAHLQLVAG